MTLNAAIQLGAGIYDFSGTRAEPIYAEIGISVSPHSHAHRPGQPTHLAVTILQCSKENIDTMTKTYWDGESPG